LIGEWSGKSIDIWNLERKVLKEFSQYKAPLNEMSMGRGMTEHFIDTLPVQEVISFIKNTHKTSMNILLPLLYFTIFAVIAGGAFAMMWANVQSINKEMRTPKKTSTSRGTKRR
jgi:hypothetical protein